MPAFPSCASQARLAAVLLAPTLLLTGCALPAAQIRPPAMLVEAETLATGRLAQALAPRLAEHPGLTGLHPLPDALDAFAARMLLARVAEHSLDVQYYIWRDDITGLLLLDALHEAAERGVRVRLLLDDNGIPSRLDPLLRALDAVEGIEVRLFNPFSLRRPKALGYLTHFSRANRRMHNKSFTADQQLTIIGGRNVGDEYFGATGGMLFADLDILAVGPVVEDMSHDFNRYWSSDSAWPVAELLPPADDDARRRLAALRSLRAAPEASAYLARVAETRFVQQLIDDQLGIEWAPVQLVSDDPAKGLGLADDSQLMISQMASLFGEPERQLDLVSPYFVPTATGTRVLGALAGNGVRVRILTNALEATDVAAVHAGYAKRRRALLEAGVELFEMRRHGDDAPEAAAGPFGSSGSSLHAKTFAVDRQRLFIGSFNFDPRSAMLNTELGFVIDHPGLATAVSDMFDDEILRHAYRVDLDAAGRLRWHQGDRILTREPGAGPLRRFGLRILSWLPIEWLL